MKMKTKMVVLAAGLAGSAAFAQQPAAQGGREAFLRRQAYEEVQRVSGQVDVLESNQAALAERVSRIERGGGEIAAVRAEIEALKADIARVRAEMQAQRREIVDDILKRIKSLPAMQPQATRPAPPPPDPGPREEYVVRPGDTLSLIAQAFGTTVGRIKEMNSLRSDAIRPGQRLYVPAQPPSPQHGRGNTGKRR